MAAVHFCRLSKIVKKTTAQTAWRSEEFHHFFQSSSCGCFLAVNGGDAFRDPFCCWTGVAPGQVPCFLTFLGSHVKIPGSFQFQEETSEGLRIGFEGFCGGDKIDGNAAPNSFLLYEKIVDPPLFTRRMTRSELLLAPDQFHAARQPS